MGRKNPEGAFGIGEPPNQGVGRTPQNPEPEEVDETKVQDAEDRYERDITRHW